MVVSIIIHEMLMNIHYNSHMFQNILQCSFESSRKFKIILDYSSNFYMFSANSRQFHVFLENSKIFQMFLEVSIDSFIVNRDRHDIPDNIQEFQSHQKTFLSVYPWQFLLFDALIFLALVLHLQHSPFVEFVLVVKDHY